MLTRPGRERLSQPGTSKGRVVGAEGKEGVSVSSLGPSVEGRKGLGKREERCCCLLLWEGGVLVRVVVVVMCGVVRRSAIVHAPTNGIHPATGIHHNIESTLRASNRAVAFPPYAPIGTEGAVASPQILTPRRKRMKPFSPQPRPHEFLATQ
jgi:hypothetical protein